MIYLINLLRCSSMKEIWLMTGNMLISPEKSIICHSYIIYHFDINVLTSTLTKLKCCIEKQIKRRRSEKWKRHEYISPMNAFTIKPNIIKKKFSPEEQSVIKALSFGLEGQIAKRIRKITDFNSYIQYPIIELPNNRGVFLCK